MPSKNRFSILAAPETSNFLQFNSDLAFNEYENLKDFISLEKKDQITDVLVLPPGIATKALAKELNKLSFAPSLILLSDGRGTIKPTESALPFTFTMPMEMPKEDFHRLLGFAAASARKRRRILALRDHQNQIRAGENNPILYLITNLIKVCTTAETYGDLLRPVLELKSVMEYEDACLALTNSKGAVLNCFYAPEEGGILEFGATPAKIPLSVNTELKQPTIYSSSAAEAQSLSEFTKYPWSSCITAHFTASQDLKKKGEVCEAHLFLYRRQLMSFAEKDLWLLEMAQGPLSLALEKVIMLKKVDTASREWRSTFDSISEPITVIDSDFQIVKANKAFANLVDVHVKKIKNKKCHLLLANRRSPCSKCPAVSETSSLQGVRVQGKDKKDLLAWSYGIALQHENYRFQFYRNVSEETALTATLVQSEKMAALGKLVGAIAHEINNPLAGILASSQMLLSDSEKNQSPIIDDIKEISSAAWRSKKIIDDLLGFTAEFNSVEERVDIAECISTAITFSKSALKDIRVNVTVEPNLPLVTSSSSSIQQVLFNLITNASHAMNGIGSLEIAALKAPDSGGIFIIVRDTGPGIPAETLKNIFDPFYTSKVEGKGTGLGLSIVKNLLGRVNGKISVTSTLGKGTEFKILIPTV